MSHRRDDHLSDSQLVQFTDVLLLTQMLKDQAKDDPLVLLGSFKSIRVWSRLRDKGQTDQIDEADTAKQLAC